MHILWRYVSSSVLFLHHILPIHLTDMVTYTNRNPVCFGFAKHEGEWHYGWTKSNTISYDESPMFYKVLAIPSGAGFCPSVPGMHNSPIANSGLLGPSHFTNNCSPLLHSRFFTIDRKFIPGRIFVSFIFAFGGFFRKRGVKPTTFSTLRNNCPVLSGSFMRL